MIDFKFLSQIIGLNQTVHHLQPHWLHGVLLWESKLGKALVVQIGDLFHFIL